MYPRLFGILTEYTMDGCWKLLLYENDFGLYKCNGNNDDSGDQNAVVVMVDFR